MTIAVSLPTRSINSKIRAPLSDLDMVGSQAKARPPPSSSGAPADASGGGKGKGRRTSDRLGVQESVNVGNAEREKERKRKAEFDEDDEGFQFKRVTSKKPRSSIEGPKLNPVTEDQKPQQSPKRGRPRKKRLDVGNDGAEDTNRTPDVAVKKSTRTTRNAAPAEVETQAGSTSRSTRKHDQAEAPPTRQHEHPEPAPAEKKRKKGRPAKQKPEERNGFVSPEPVQTSTATISLPMADTPVIQRNKEMRTKKSEKGNRRSSLGMRGRRASSLIDSGTSNALPHKEVDTAEFYKHIASDLPEPRRMRQLLIWCATRAMGDKPTGFHSKDQNARSEDQSARLAARVIQEEILKDFSMNSELSNWFEREDANPPAVVVKKPNPKNVQNLDKIRELEEQIQRLQREKHSLNELLRPPSIPSVKPQKHPPNDKSSQPESTSTQSESEIDKSLLNLPQQTILASLQPPEPQQQPSNQELQQSQPPTSLPPLTPSAISSRLSQITTTLAPTLDTFASGIHDIDLYRTMADTVSSRVLRICSQRLEERDARNAMRRLDIAGKGDESGRVQTPAEMPREDISVILGALSRAER